MRGRRGGGFGRRPMIYRGFRPVRRYPIFWGGYRFMGMRLLFGLGSLLMLLILFSLMFR
ncbi:MAG: hypothetical protein KC496_03755 [Anaerolineae bacterium]|nr:hypothetical protein [Anaerolineae bacterium]